MAKQWGHPESSVGSLGAWSTNEKNLQAQKQVAVQNALAMAGFPLPASALLSTGPEWVLMERVEGIGLMSIEDESERAIASEQARTASQQMEPIVAATLEPLKEAHPESAKLFHVAMDVDGNTLFARTHEGWAIAGIFDPIF